MNKRAKYFLTTASALGMVLLGTQAFAAHPDENVCVPHWDGVSADVCGPVGGNVPLLDHSGNPVTGGSKAAYSPKKTCGGCHNYESDWATATKEQSMSITGTSMDAYSASYQVPYPQHGVTAGFHFQQGMNHDWTATQKHFYHVPDFTSSGAMYGKY